MNENILYRAVLETPRGQMVAMATDKGLVALEFIQPKRQHLLAKRLDKWFHGYRIEESSNKIIEMTATWLKDYFQNNKENLKTPPLELRGTEFELRVWHQLQSIPFGETWTYRQLATALGNPNGSRAVGGANGRNPISLIVPCHRVIGSNQSLVGYGGGLKIKKALLQQESPAGAGGGINEVILERL